MKLIIELIIYYWSLIVNFSSTIAPWLLVRQSLSGQAPVYLADDCWLVSDSTRRSYAVNWRSNLRGATNTQQVRRQSLVDAGPRLWNSLSVQQLRNPDITYGLFRLKGHLFREAWTRRSVTSDRRRRRKTLTYLLTCLSLFATLVRDVIQPDELMLPL